MNSKLVLFSLLVIFSLFEISTTTTWAEDYYDIKDAEIRLISTASSSTETSTSSTTGTTGIADNTNDDCSRNYADEIPIGEDENDYENICNSTSDTISKRCAATTDPKPVSDTCSPVVEEVECEDIPFIGCAVPSWSACGCVSKDGVTSCRPVNTYPGGACGYYSYCNPEGDKKCEQRKVKIIVGCTGVASDKCKPIFDPKGRIKNPVGSPQPREPDFKCPSNGAYTKFNVSCEPKIVISTINGKPEKVCGIRQVYGCKCGANPVCAGTNAISCIDDVDKIVVAETTFCKPWSPISDQYGRKWENEAAADAACRKLNGPRSVCVGTC